MSTAQRALDALAERVVLEGDRVRAELRAGLKETKDGQRITGARFITNVLPDLSDAYRTRSAWGGPCRLMGWSVRAPFGTASVDILDGQGGDMVASFQLAQGQSVTQWFGVSGVSLGTGLYLSLTGLVWGGFYIGAVD